MKTNSRAFSTYLLLALTSMMGAPISANAQIPTGEEKQQIIAGLDSADNQIVSSCLFSVLQYKIVEAVPALERNLWRQPTSMRYRFLQALTLFSAPTAGALAIAFIDSLDRVTEGTIDPLFYKARTAILLFEEGDYSKASYVFKFLEERSSQIDMTVVESLRKIAVNNPQLEDSVLHALRFYAQNGQDGDVRLSALNQLVSLKGTEVYDLIVDRATNDSVDVVRFTSLKRLFELGYPDLQNFLRDRMIQEQAESYRLFIAESLLVRFESPGNLKVVSDYQNNEPDLSTRQLIGFAVSDFKPQIPELSTSIVELLDELAAINQEVFDLAWVADANFFSELNADILNGRSFLLSGDSAGCVSSIRLFQSKVNDEYRDSLDNDSRNVEVEGWKFLYHKAEYVLDRLPTLATLSPYSLLAAHSLWFEQNSQVITGDIGVNDAGSPPFLNSDVELTVGIGTVVSSMSVKAHRIKVKDGSIINSNVYCNSIENNGTITGQLYSSVALPLVSAMPELKTATPGSTSMTIPQDGQQTLIPGSYGDVLVRKNGRLTLTGGVYHFNSFDIGDNAQILFQGPSEMRIAQRFDSDQGTYIGPEDTTSLSADNIVFYVGGINGSTGNLSATPKAAQIGIANTVKANFYVPNGTLWIRQNSEATGAFIGKDVDVGIGVKVWLKSAF